MAKWSALSAPITILRNVSDIGVTTEQTGSTLASQYKHNKSKYGELPSCLAPHVLLFISWNIALACKHKEMLAAITVSLSCSCQAVTNFWSFLHAWTPPLFSVFLMALYDFSGLLAIVIGGGMVRTLDFGLSTLISPARSRFSNEVGRGKGFFLSVGLPGTHPSASF